MHKKAVVGVSLPTIISQKSKAE